MTTMTRINESRLCLRHEQIVDAVVVAAAAGEPGAVPRVENFELRRRGDGDARLRNAGTHDRLAVLGDQEPPAITSACVDPLPNVQWPATR